jgi:cobalamin biosynthesis protein CobD/CbiB
VRLQLVLLYVLLGGVAIAALVAVLLAQRSFFTPAHQLREPDRDGGRAAMRRTATALMRRSAAKGRASGRDRR